MNFSNRTILITGGNSGIGKALAEALQARGNRIIITGRNRQTLDIALRQNPNMTGYVLDVTDAASLAIFPSKLLENHPQLDVIILNAGIMEAEDYSADPVTCDVAQRTIATNLIAPIQLALAFVPHLRTRPQAAVVTVSSGLAFVPKAINPVYSATKAAIHSWSQSLRHQLRETSVRVYEIVPPLVATELTPGQSQVEAALPLCAFIQEVIDIFSIPEVPDEILVERVNFHRRAVEEGRYAAAFKAING